MSWGIKYAPSQTAPAGNAVDARGRIPSERLASFTQGPNTGFPRAFERNWDVTGPYGAGMTYLVPVKAGWKTGDAVFRAGGLVPTFRPPVGGLEAYDYSQHPEAWTNPVPWG